MVSIVVISYIDWRRLRKRTRSGCVGAMGGGDSCGRRASAANGMFGGQAGFKIILVYRPSIAMSADEEDEGSDALQFGHGG